MKHKLSALLGIALSALSLSQAYAAAPKQTKPEVSFGVIADPHGNFENVAVLSALMKQQGVNGIIFPGDLCNNETLRTGQEDSVPDKKEIHDVLEVAAKTRLPIYVIPGNHETRPDYDSALAGLTRNYSNIVDMSKTRTYSNGGINFVSLPGYDTFKIPGRQFIPDNGFFAKPEDIREISDLVQGLNGPVVLIAHGPPKTPDGKRGIDTIYSGRNVGSKETDAAMKKAKIKHGTFGHIHEAGGMAVDSKGDYVPQDKWSAEVRLNPGSADEWKYLNGTSYPGMAGIITVNAKTGEAKYHIIALEK